MSGAGIARTRAGYFCVFVACFLVTACHKAADRAQSGNNAGTPELALDDRTVRVQDAPQGDGGTEGGANCAGGGTLVTGTDGGSTTVNNLARSIFTNALCSCDSLAVSGKLKTDGFDSTVGPPDGGVGATVAIDGLVNWTAATTIGGDLWAGEGLSSKGVSSIAGNLHVAGSVTANAALTVAGNAFSVGTLPAQVSVAGTLSHPTSIADQCDCNNLVPVAAIVAAHAAPNNDNATIGLDPNVATGTNPAQIDLPCGNYYLSEVTSTGTPLTINVHGQTALYINGDFSPDDTVTVNLDPQATLDAFVAGQVAGGDNMVLGSSAHPGNCRLYVAGGAMQTGGDMTIGCNVYAPNVTVAVPPTSYGSVFGGAIFGGSMTVHYDKSVGTAATSCTPASCDDGNPCTTDTCNGDGTCSHTSATNGTSCTGTNLCEQTYSCQSGVCTGSNPVTCTASDQCHVAGTCSPSTGTCSNPTAADGASCNDGNACTQTDTCQSGTCTGTNPVTCTASDQCHVAGTCNPSTGACSNPAATNGTTCSDGNACTVGDACQAGACQPGTATTCVAQDACHVAGSCDPGSGACSNPAAANGTACNDGNACTQTDSCQGGTCTGANPVTCPASDACHVAGTCNPSTGACSNPTASDGTACSDGNACTQSDACANGVCVGSNPVACAAGDQCHATGTCDPTSGACSNPALANGTACNDGNACTQTDSCQSGACVGSNPVACPAPDACHTAGTCDTTSGTCSSAPLPDGTTCGTAAACTSSPTCLSGACQAGTPLTIDDGNPCTLDTCDATNGVAHHACSTIDRTVGTVLADAESFLFSGTNPVQTGVAAGTIVPANMAVVRGQVSNRSGSPLAGVTVTVVNHPEFGSTLTQGDGSFDMAVNGGQTLRLHYALTNYLPAERLVQAPWQDYVTADDAILVQVDAQVTTVDLSSSGGMQVARGAPSTDADGTRQATLLVPPDTQATMTMPDGTTTPLDAMHMRATEYTVGTNGPSAMPASLPPTSAYTYAVELSADEALSAGAKEITFSQPMPFYVDNFLGFPVGIPVPAGYYDPSQGGWVASTSGVVLKIVSVTGGEADVDLTGDGVADTGSALTAIGVTDLERQQLATLYSVGTSLWRIPIAHFSPWDLNWGLGPPPGATPPNVPPPVGGDPGAGPGACEQTGSIIQCQRQVLGETIPIAGTPYSLNYESDRQLGRQATLQIALSGATLPGPVSSIEMEIDVAGRKITQSFPPQPNQTYTFVWDRKDIEGRILQGAQPVTVRVGNTYTATVYKSVSSFGFDLNATSITGSRTRQQLTIWNTWQAYIGGWDNVGQGLGGWSVNVQPAYDISGQSLHLGGGGDLTSAFLPNTVQPVAGLQPFNGTGNGDGGLALAALISANSVAVGPDRSLYLTDSESCVRRITPDGIINTFAGQCSHAGFSGDGGPATSAQLLLPMDVAVGPDGSIYIADANNHRIRRVFPNGIIQTVAGSGPTGSSGGAPSGDGGPAVQATMGQAWSVDVAQDGTIYVADATNDDVRRVGPDGIITTVAGIGAGGCFSQNSKGYGGPATAAHLCSAVGVRVAKDGSFYIAEENADQVDRVGVDGIITAFAGTGALGRPHTGDGGPATAATLDGPYSIAIGPDGNVYITETNTIRRVDATGIINTIVGQANANGNTGIFGPATLATIAGQQGGVAIAPDGIIYIAEPENNRIIRVGGPLPGFTSSTNQVQLVSSDGKQVQVFDGTGRALETLDAFTNAVLYQFGYDGNGLLASITDVNGEVTRINRDATGLPMSIVGPFGEQTTLAVDTNGYLASFTDPASEQTQFTYDPTGLMQTETDPRGGLHQFSFDPQGRLTEDQDPAGGSKTLVNTSVANGFTVNVTTALGVQSTYQTTTTSTGGTQTDGAGSGGGLSTLNRLNTLSNGLQSSLHFGSDGTTTTRTPDGTTTTTTDAPDPRFGMLSPMPSVTTATPSGLTATQTTTRAVTFSNTGALATFTEKTNRNGNTWTDAFNASALTWTTTSPVGRTTTTAINAAGRPTQIAVPNTNPLSFVYDANGRLSTTTQGGNTWTQAYDTQGYLASLTDPLTHATSFTNDPVGRPTQTRLADGRLLGTGYDGDSNTTSLTLPSTEQHLFSFSPVDLLSSYTPPSLGSASTETQYTYDVDRHLETVSRPDGVTVGYGYDSAGRLLTTTYPQGTITLAYNPTTGQLASSAAPSGEGLQYAYDGFLRTVVTWGGPVAGTLTLGFDNNFRMTSQTVNGTALAFGYDLDGLLTGAGALTLTLDSQNGRLNATTLGSMTDAYTYDPNGHFASYTAKYSGNMLYSESVIRDAVGRITQKTETVQGTTHVWGYTFDPDGRLTDVTEDGNFFSHYAYDADDNRTTYTNTSGTVNPSYDTQDRLTAYGGASYGYTANGELTSKTVGSETTSYTYDALGNLLHVGPPSGSAFDYVIDGENRRVGKKIGGTLTTGYLYQDALNVVAQLDGGGNLVARYVFGSKPNVPDYFTSSAGTFRILSDHLGSPRLVVNTSSGAVVEEIDYDEFGNVTNDTSPGLTPFGFAGGLYDKDTGLVRFGARDYDASVGRWTAKDPIRFGGGMNLYGYALNDPIDRIDPDGQWPNGDCIAYLSAECTRACQGNARGDCYLWCMLGEVGAAIADPEYCIEPTNSPRCQNVFEMCIGEATSDVLLCDGPFDKSGPFYAAIRDCMTRNNCQY
jgi:RHS repeat-associated protein